MNIQTIQLHPTESARAQSYRHTHGDPELAAIRRGYRALAKGQTLVHLHDVMREAGLDIAGRPRLAICRADFRFCFVDHHWNYGVVFWGANNKEASFNRRAKRSRVEVPHIVFPRRLEKRHRDVVPIIPPTVRPRGNLSRYHVLWEAQWEAVPVDPLLLRHLGGPLYAVLAEWELTALERAVLGERLV
jgi:hypothetical protein